MLWSNAAERLNCFHSSHTASHCLWFMHIRHTSASFSYSSTLAISLSHLFVSLRPSPCLSHTHTQRRRCAALWQQPVSSVNDLWRVSRCVSLGSFRFVSTELYLRAPFMRPQVWLGEEGGELPNSLASPCRGQEWKTHEHDGALPECWVQCAQGVLQQCHLWVFCLDTQFFLMLFLPETISLLLMIYF